MSLKRRIEKNPLEWTVAAVGIAVVLATAGFLAWDAASGDGSAPDLRIELGRSIPRSGGFAVPVTVHNLGGVTAEGVHIEVTLETPGAAPEQAGLDIAFVPRSSRRHGWVTFESDPAAGRLSGRATGYGQP
jgi:uncharacterized protein (TIGR02588 family)